MWNRNFTRAAVLLSVAISLCSCVDRQQGAALADAGIKTSNSLSDFYGLLITDVTESTELEAYNGSLRGTPVSDSELKILNQTATALRARQSLSTQMLNAYTSLNNLSSYDSAGELKSAATSLATSVKSLPVFPAGGVDPASLIGDVAGEIASAKQNRDIVKSAKILQKELAAIEKLFQMESPQYQSIIEEQGNKVIVVADGLVDLGYLGTSSLLQEVPQTLGLDWIGPQKLSGDAANEAIKQLMHTRVNRSKSDALSATQAEGQALAQLRTMQGALIANEGSVSLGDVTIWITKANAYLDDIEALRKAKQTAAKENL